MIQSFNNLDVSTFFLLNNLAGYSPVTDFIIIFFAEYLAYTLITIFLFLIYRSTYNLREKLTMLSVVGFSSLAARYGVTELIRLFYHRPRPFLTYHVHQLIPETSYSFPSGHSTFFFAFSYAIYLYNRKWGTWFLCATIIMTISRIIAGIHYPSDIVGGMIIGIIIAKVSFIYLKVYFKNLWKHL
jgi:undecaprenyl-diphosphatase